MNSKQKILTAIKVDWTPIFLVVIPYVGIFLRDYRGKQPINPDGRCRVLI